MMAPPMINLVITLRDTGFHRGTTSRPALVASVSEPKAFSEQGLLSMLSSSSVVRVSWVTFPPMQESVSL